VQNANLCADLQEDPVPASPTAQNKPAARGKMKELK
jgi:hypothetical protein